MRRCLVALTLVLMTLPARAGRIQVVDAAAAPVAGAEIRWLGGRAPADADGWVELPDSAPGACAIAPRSLPASVERALAAGDPSITLRAASTILGVVQAPDGSPVAGVGVRVAADFGAPGDAPEPCARAAVSDAAGAYTLDGLVPGASVELAIVPPADYLAPRPRVRARATAGARLDLRVHPACRVSVAVTRPDGKPATGASVRVHADWDRLALDPPLDGDARREIDDFRGIADESGTVSLPLLARGRSRLSATHAEFAPISATVDLRAATASVPLRLTRGGSVTMRAVDESAVARAGIVATLSSASVVDADLVPASRPSAADGVVRFDRVPAGRHDADLRGPGARPVLVRGLVVRDGALTERGDVVMPPGAPVGGIVLGEGRAIEGATVTLWTRAAGAPLRLTTATDARGGFLFEGLDPDERVDVRAEADGYLADRQNEREPGEMDLAFELARAASLAITAHDGSTGEPLEAIDVSLAGARVAIRRAEAEPVEGSPGEFLASSLAAGERDVTVRAQGLLPETRKGVVLLAGDVVRLRFDLAKGASIAGRVADAATGAPIPFAQVSAQASATRSAADGTFLLEGLRAPCDVVARHDAFMTARALLVDPASLPAEGLVMTMSRGGALEGTVRGADGAPIAGAEVSVDGEGENKSAIADEAGRYRLDGIKPGSQRATKVDRPGSHDGRQSVTVGITEGSVTRLDFGGGPRIKGTVTRGGEAVRGVQIAVLRSVKPEEATAVFDAELSSTRSDADGQYVLLLPRPGDYGLNVAAGERRITRMVTVPEGVPELVHDIALSDLHVAGRVVDAESGEPLQAWLGLTPTGARSGGSMSTSMSSDTADGMREILSVQNFPGSRGESGADGSFRLAVDRPGPHSFWAHVEGYESWSAPEDFAITDSLDDMRIALVKKKTTGRVNVRLVDATSGDAVTGTIMMMTRASDSEQGGSTMTTGGSSTGSANAPDPGGVMTILALADGRGLALRDGIEHSATDVDITIGMSPGGGLRLLVPEGALTADRMLGYKGDLRIQLASGLDLGPPNMNVQANILGRIITQAAPGEWLLRDLPAGPLTLTLGNAAPRTVDILAGDTVEADLR